MDAFFPFIHKIEKKKKQDELQPLYIEIEPPPPPQKEEEEKDDNHQVIVIEL